MTTRIRSWSGGGERRGLGALMLIALLGLHCENDEKATGDADAGSSGAPIAGASAGRSNTATGGASAGSPSKGGGGGGTSDIPGEGGQAGEGVGGQSTAGGGAASAGRGGAFQAAPGERTRYPASVTHSPLTPAVAENLRRIADRASDRDERVVLPIGDVNCAVLGPGYFWSCLAPDGDVTWGEHASLRPTAEFFGAGRVGGESTFLLDTFETTCREAGIAVNLFEENEMFGSTGIEYELARLKPRFAVLQFGVGEIEYFDGMGEASWQAQLAAIDLLRDNGTIPIVFSSMAFPLDDDSADPASAVADAILRGLAEGRQVPFVSRYTALLDAPSFGYGAASHLTAYVPGDGSCEVVIPQPDNCNFTEQALECGFNKTVLLTLQALDRVKRVVVDGEDGDDGEALPPLRGSGTAEDPFIVDELPFTHFSSEADGRENVRSDYRACGGGSNEAGPGRVYHLTLDRPTKVRYFGVNSKSNRRKLGVRHFEGGLSGDCRGSTGGGALFAQGATLEAGEHVFVVDGPEGSGQADFLFGIVPCEAGDTSCD